MYCGWAHIRDVIRTNVEEDDECFIYDFSFVNQDICIHIFIRRNNSNFFINTAKVPKLS